MSKLSELKELVLNDAETKGCNEHQLEILGEVIDDRHQDTVVQTLTDILANDFTYEDYIGKMIKPYNINKLNNGIKERIAKGEHSVMGVGDAFSYSIGLSALCKNNPHEIVCALSTGGPVINEVVNKYPDGNYPISPFSLDSYRVGDEPLRIQQVTLSSVDEVKEALFGRIEEWTEVPLTKLYLLHLADSANLLPGEEGYNHIDQSIEAIIERYGQ